MLVRIEHKTIQKVVARDTIHLSSLDAPPSEAEYFAEAWKCAIEDAIVSSTEKALYRFNLSNEEVG